MASGSIKYGTMSCSGGSETMRKFRLENMPNGVKLSTRRTECYAYNVDEAKESAASILRVEL